MTLRFIFICLFLTLTGCATTGTGTKDQDAAAPESDFEAYLPPSTVTTVDEHLYEPESETDVETIETAVPA